MLSPRLTDPLHAAALRLRRFLDAHWFVRWFVIPLLFMGTGVFLLALALPSPTPIDGAQLLLAYLLVSFIIVLLGLAVDKLAVYAVTRTAR